MKRGVLFVLSVTLLCSYLFGGTPPTAVQKTFMEKYQSATKISWDNEDTKEWEAKFTFEGYNLSANFAENGTWIDTERKIKIADVPTAIAETINSIYTGWTIHKIVKKETPKSGTVYEVSLKKSTEKETVTLNEDGTKVPE
jgi:hypothetical protein